MHTSFCFQTLAAETATSPMPHVNRLKMHHILVEYLTDSITPHGLQITEKNQLYLMQQLQLIRYGIVSVNLVEPISKSDHFYLRNQQFLISLGMHSDDWDRTTPKAMLGRLPHLLPFSIDRPAETINLQRAWTHDGLTAVERKAVLQQLQLFGRPNPKPRNAFTINHWH